MTRILAAFLLPLLAALDVHAQAAPLRFVFFADNKPVLIELRAEIDGKPARTAWSDYLRKWFDLLDRDRDGLLDGKETLNAPTDDLLLQTMRQGIFYPRPGMAAPKMQATGDKIRFEDFLRYYEVKAGPYQFGNALQTNNAGSTILHQAIDRDKDKALTRFELEQAAAIMDALDKSDDEIITADELGGNVAGNFGNQIVIVNGGMQPQQTIGNDAFLHINEGVGGKLALLLLTHYDRNSDKALKLAESGMNAKVFDDVDANRDGQLDVVELAAWHDRPADLQLVSRLGRATESKSPRVEAVNTEKLADIRATEDGILASIGDAQITLKAEPENANQMIGANRGQFIMQIFRQIDKENKRIIEKKDLQNTQNAQYSLLGQYFPFADVNDDGKMTEEELRGFVTLQEGAKDCFTTVGITDQGRAFFQILDANRDGRLSVRELRTAWARMLEFDANQDGVISGNEVARQFQVSIGRGQNLAYYRAVAFNQGLAVPNAPAASRNAPLWFRKMDQNSDGDISQREFLGTRAQFQGIDADGDGLLSPAEASAMNERRK